MAEFRELVIHLSQLRQQFSKLNPRNLGRNRLERGTHFIGGVRFRIPQIDVTRPPLQINHNHTLGPPPTWTSGPDAASRRLSPQFK